MSDDDSEEVYRELDRWERSPKIQFHFYLRDDFYVSALDKTIHYSPKFKTFVLNVDDLRDVELLKRARRLKPFITGRTCYFYFEEPLAKAPATAEEALEEYEKARK